VQALHDEHDSAACRVIQTWAKRVVVSSGSRSTINVPGVIAINPQGGKVARMFAAAPEWQSGDWYVDRNAAWTEPFVEQITMFPNAAHDDQADMMSQASAWLLQASFPTVAWWPVRL